MSNLNIHREKEQSKSSVYAWYVVLLCMLAYIFSFIDRQILALMIEPIKADLNLTDTQFSLLHGLAFSLFYAFMGLPLAYLADRFSRPKIIAVGIVFWSIATALCGLSKNFIQLFFSRMGVGVGEAALSPAAYSMFSDMFSKDKLGRAVAVYSIGSFVGGGIAFLVGGYVIGLLKDMSLIQIPIFGAIKAWQMAFILVGLPGVFIGLLFLLTVRDPQRKGQKLNAAGQVEKVSMKATFQFLKKHRTTFSCHYFGFTFYAMALYCLISWSPAFFMRKFSMTPTEAGYMLGTVLLVANTLGVFCAGWLNDWLIQKGRKDAPMITGVIGIVGLVLPLIAFTQVSELWLVVTLLAPAMFFASFPMPISTTAMQMLAPNQLRAQISAIFLLISNLVAVGIGTTLVALVTDKVFENPLMVGTSLSIVGGISCVLAFILLKKGCKAFSTSMQQEQGQGIS
ncbi:MULTISPECIES: MFS transporter [unclassified Acinetobacter]|uniref:spinster family MFS transporter n=1 Tax=unclassified Acinetobacter TaxID=196816 RepID=UPI002577F5C6|nr:MULTISPECIES: MFS transporter [unclassified Acinetobacter]MDM1764682.1 MFS transporter [Acinetobacter sp. 226-1]MDM1768678.1 MFS transporter [Acinetobacter sp. 226-4]